MKKTTVELTIHGDYVKTWGLDEGVREILQNAIDGERQYKFEMCVGLDGETLMVASLGGSIPREALLTGFTTKEGQQKELSGQFGEGLKLGLLALVRDGHGVVVWNHGEKWTPSIRRSRKFKADVLALGIEGCKEHEGDFVVEIEGVGDEVWQNLRKKFLFLMPPKDFVTTYRGVLILDPDRKGDVFCKGIWIMHDDALRYGYDLPYLKVDRDRRMVADFDLSWEMACVWDYAMAAPKYADIAFEILKDEAKDVLGLKYDAFGSSAKKMAERFVSKYGDKAVPVTHQADGQDIAYLGGFPIHVPAGCAEVLKKELGGVFENKRKLTEQRFTIVERGVLTLSEIEVLDTVLSLVQQAGYTVPVDKLLIVEFADPNLLGQYDPKTGIAKIGRSRLLSLEKALGTVVHELAHVAGNDRDAQHRDVMAEMFSRIIVSLISKTEKPTGLEKLLEGNGTIQ